MPKSTDAEIELRVQEIAQAIIQGYNYLALVRYCKEKWGITSTQTVHKYIVKAREKFQEEGRASLEQNRQEALSRYKELIRQLTTDLFKTVEREVNGKMTTVRIVNDTAMRHVVAILRRMDRITGLESIVHKIEGAMDIFKMDVPISDADKKELEEKIDKLFFKRKG